VVEIRVVGFIQGKPNIGVRGVGSVHKIRDNAEDIHGCTYKRVRIVGSQYRIEILPTNWTVTLLGVLS
jgi:hypothetical protein